MFEQTFKNIDDRLWKDPGGTGVFSHRIHTSKILLHRP
jgi:hypothetical protein